jgi:hypothetical protein
MCATGLPLKGNQPGIRIVKGDGRWGSDGSGGSPLDGRGRDCWLRYVSKSYVRYFGAKFTESVWIVRKNIFVNSGSPNEETGFALPDLFKHFFLDSDGRVLRSLGTDHSHGLVCGKWKVETLCQFGKRWLTIRLNDSILGRSTAAVRPVNENLLARLFSIGAVQPDSQRIPRETQERSLGSPSKFARSIGYLIHLVGKEGKYSGEYRSPGSGFPGEQKSPYFLRHVGNFLLICISVALFIAFVGTVRHWLESGGWSFLPLAMVSAYLWYLIVIHIRM